MTYSTSSRRLALACACVFTGLIGPGGTGAFGQDEKVNQPITLTIGSGITNVGDTVEANVDLSSANAAPSVIVLVIAFDATKLQPVDNFYQFIQTDPLGVPVHDDQGNTITQTSAVRPGAILTSAGKVVSSNTYPEGAIGIAIEGGNTTIANGSLLTVAFKVLPAAQENEVLALTGAGDDDPIMVHNASNQVEPLSSSASQPSAARIPVTLVDGHVTLGCTAADTPTNVAATENLSNGVQVTWNAVSNPGAMYRVYRSSDTNVANAVPLGSAWQTATTYLDVTDAPAAVSGGGGCSNGTTTTTTQYYWVKARTATGCESAAFSTPPAAGFRSGSKAAIATGTTAAAVFPEASASESAKAAGVDDQLAVRLASSNTGDPIDAATIWSSLDGADAAQSAPAWVPGGDGSGWVVYEAEGAWPANASLVLTAGAQTLSGRPVGPVTMEFLTSGAAVGSKSAALTPVSIEDALTLPGAQGAAYELSPEGVYIAPLEIEIPVPATADAALVGLYYLQQSPETQWYPAADVADWLATPVSIVYHDGQAYAHAAVRHSGILQLAQPTAVAQSAMTIPVPRNSGAALGDLLVLAVGAAALVRFRNYRNTAAS